MGLLGPPNIQKMTDKKDRRGLIKAMQYQKNEDVQLEAKLATLDLYAKVGVYEPHERDWDDIFDTIVTMGNTSHLSKILIAYIKDRANIWGQSNKIDSFCQRLAHIQEVSEAATPTLIQMMSDCDWSVRKSAIEFLGYTGNLDSLHPIMEYHARNLEHDRRAHKSEHRFELSACQYAYANLYLADRVRFKSEYDLLGDAEKKLVRTSIVVLVSDSDLQ